MGLGLSLPDPMNSLALPPFPFLLLLLCVCVCVCVCPEISPPELQAVRSFLTSSTKMTARESNTISTGRGFFFSASPPPLPPGLSPFLSASELFCIPKDEFAGARRSHPASGIWLVCLSSCSGNKLSCPSNLLPRGSRRQESMRSSVRITIAWSLDRDSRYTEMARLCQSSWLEGPRCRSAHLLRSCNPKRHPERGEDGVGSVG